MHGSKVEIEGCVDIAARRHEQPRRLRRVDAIEMSHCSAASSTSGRIGHGAPSASRKAAARSAHTTSSRKRDRVAKGWPCAGRAIAARSAHAGDGGMRGVERSLHEVLPAAVLCEQMGSVACRYDPVASTTPPPALDAILPCGVVPRAFAERVLDDRKRACDGPSALMLA